MAHAQALDALTESLKCLERSNSAGTPNKTARLEVKVELLKLFVNALQLADQDEKTALSLCDQLLHEPNIDVSVLLPKFNLGHN